MKAALTDHQWRIQDFILWGVINLT